MRGQVSALYLFFLNLVAVGLGPTFTAAITDFVFRDEAAVGYSIAITCVISGIAAALLLRAGQRPFRELANRLI